jgi:PadR family transcriptional regulator PadR
MPRDDGLPPGTLVMLVLRVLAKEPLHGYAIAQRIAQVSGDELSVEEGSLYPALQKLLLKGWVKASPTVSETGRAVRAYRLTASGRREYRITSGGRKQLEAEEHNYRRVSRAIVAILEGAS